MTTLLDELGAGCNQCGRCCLTKGGVLSGTDEDVRRWEAAGDQGAAILKWVAVLRSAGVIAAVDLWFDPVLDNVWGEARCPWVEESDGAYSCSIYQLRPDVCREFPTRPEQIESMCIPGGVEVRWSDFSPHNQAQ